MDIVAGKLPLLACQVQQTLRCRGKVGLLARFAGNDFAAIAGVNIFVWSSGSGLRKFAEGFLRLCSIRSGRLRSKAERSAPAVDFPRNSWLLSAAAILCLGIQCVF
jgi:hypothetical protein